MEQHYRVLIIGSNLFTETLQQIFASAEGFLVVGTAPLTEATAVPLPQPCPHAIIIAEAGIHDQNLLNHLLDTYPNIPIINTSLDQNYVQIITHRRVRARRDDLLAVMMELAKEQEGDL